MNVSFNAPRFGKTYSYGTEEAAQQRITELKGQNVDAEMETLTSGAMGKPNGGAAATVMTYLVHTDEETLDLTDFRARKPVVKPLPPGIDLDNLDIPWKLFGNKE